jgi:hypothetical protein
MTDEPAPDVASPCLIEATFAESSVDRRWRSIQRTTLWLTLSAAGAICVAWIAIQAQNKGVAPVGLAALLIGAAVAEISARSAKSVGAGDGWPRLASAIVLAATVVLAQDYIGFREHLVDLARCQSANPKTAAVLAGDDLAGPAAFCAFLQARIRRAPALWSIDAALTIGAAIAWTVFRARNEKRIFERST